MKKYQMIVTFEGDLDNIDCLEIARELEDALEYDSADYLNIKDVNADIKEMK